MKKILSVSIFVLAFFSTNAQNINFVNLYGNGGAEPQYYHISNTFEPIRAGWVLDMAWWAGISLQAPSGDIKLKTPGGSLQLSQNGNVGIGVDNPLRKLTVQGDIYAGGPASLSFQDDSRFTVYKTNVPSLSPQSIEVPQYGFIAPNAGGAAELWISGHAGIRMFTAGQVIPKFAIAVNGDASLQGKFEAKEVKVTQTPTADFVFEETYGLPKLEDVEKYIKVRKHLPEIASAKEMEKEGVNIGEFQIKLLQKIEELTLYSIEQNKQIKNQTERIQALESENLQFKTLLKRIEKLEKNN